MQTQSLKKTNLIDLLTADLHSEDAPRTYCIIINALTGMACSQIMKHLSAVRRGTAVAEDTPPDLDLRNEQDEHARGEEVSNFLTHAAGHIVAMPPLKAAAILDGIRHTLYEDMFAWGDFAKPEALILTPPTAITDKVNYDQPMSAQMYLQFRIDNADKIDERVVASAVKRLSLHEDIIRDALNKEAARNKIALQQMTPAILSELQSFDDVYDTDAFMTLDVVLQCMIAEKIATKFDQLHARLLPAAIRGSLEGMSKLESVQRQHKQVKDWLHANDAELQQAMLARQAA